MSKVLTISENETTGIGYAVLLTKFSREHIQRTIAKGLKESWYSIEQMAEDIAKDNEAYEVLKESGSAYYGEGRFMVCITALSEEPSENEGEIEDIGNPEDVLFKKEKDPIFSPFKSIEVEAEVDWEIDEGEEGIARRYVEKFSADRLKELGFIEEVENCPSDWKFKEGEFRRWFSYHISGQTGYFHNGFSATYAEKR